MKRSRKSKKAVSWASDFDLCQVRLFLTEDCPSKVGSEAQDHLQKKTPWILQHLNHKESDDIPPGFEGIYYFDRIKEKSPHIPRIEWKCPPKFVMSDEWCVAAGEDSQEVEAQQLREMQVLEAVYPRLSAIPPSPSVTLNIEHEDYDDSLTPIIPLIPIEGEEAADAPSDLKGSDAPAMPQDLLSSVILNSLKGNTFALEPPATEKPAVLLPDPAADPITAASAALITIMKSEEKGSLIDTDLLVKILSDPKMIEKLITGKQSPAGLESAPIPALKSVTGSITPSLPKVLAPISADVDSHLPSKVHSASNSVVISAPQSGPKPVMPFSQMPDNRSMNHLPSDVQLTVSRLPLRPDTGLKQVSLPISMPRPKSFDVSAPRGAVGNFYPKLNQAQPTLSTQSSQPIAIHNSPFTSTEPSPDPNFRPLTLGTIPGQSTSVPRTSVGAMKSNPVKDVNYIKNLIREHGVQKETRNWNISQNNIYDNHTQNMKKGHNTQLGQGKSKIQKPCMFFKSSKGCRNGSSCPYQHDMSFQLQSDSALEAPYAKRMKLSSGEISGI